MRQFTITVRAKHLKKAVRAIKKSEAGNICTRCVVAQALKEVRGLGLRSMGFTTALTNNGTFECEKAERITGIGFSREILENPERIAALLPMKLKFVRTRQPK